MNFFQDYSLTGHSQVSTHHAHVGGLDRKLSVGDEVDVVVLEEVLKVRDVLRVLVAVESEARHL